MATKTHPDIAVDWVREKLNVSELLDLTVTVAGEAREVQGVFYLAAPQETANPYPAVIINQPLYANIAQRLQINGPWITAAVFEVEVRIAGRDVEPDDSGLRAIRAKVQELCEGQNGTVTGGRVDKCIVWPSSPDQRNDKGNFIYSDCFIKFRVGVQLD